MHLKSTDRDPINRLQSLNEIEAGLTHLQEAAEGERFDMLSYLIKMALDEVHEIRKTRHRA